MKKTAQTLALFVGVLSVFFVAQPAHAQLGHFVILQQGNIGSTTSFYTGSKIWSARLGNGLSGTTTGAFMAASFHKNLSTDQNLTLQLNAYSDSGYSVNVGSCQYDSRNLATGFYSATSSNPFIQLDYNFGSACNLNPSYYYTIDLTASFSTFGGSSAGSVAGNGNFAPPAGWTITSQPLAPFFPQFSIVTGGFTITPSATSSTGLSSLSGAQAFCNNQFGTSTTGIFGIGTDLANGICQVAGFMFIPSTDSLNVFSDFTNQLQTRFPFSWGFQIKDIFNSLVGSSTANYPSVSYGIGTTTPGYYKNIVGTSLFIADGTSVKKLAPDSTWTLIRYLIGVILWISFAYFIYRKVLGIWHTKSA